jgi:hypothetical protein
MTKAKTVVTALEEWTDEARKVASDESPAKVPLYVLFGEAVDVAKFFQAYWETKRDDKKNVIQRGLDSAATKSDKLLTAKTGGEILSLQRAAQDAHTAYLLAVDPKNSDPMERGQYVLGEITATLEWLFDDGVEDEKDAKLARLEEVHADDDSTDAMASALDDYATLAQQHRAEMDGLGGFDPKLIDEARSLAVTLRDRPVTPLALPEKTREALALRNKIVTLLVDRMNRVRSAARFVFRDQPEIARQVTSAYERRRRAASRRVAAKKKAEPKPSPAPSPFPTPSPSA